MNCKDRHFASFGQTLQPSIRGGPKGPKNTGTFDERRRNCGEKWGADSPFSAPFSPSPEVGRRFLRALSFGMRFSSFAPFATVPLRRCVDERDGRFKTGHVRHSFFRRATAPLTFRGRGALGVGVFFFIILSSTAQGSIFVCTGVQGSMAFRTTQVDGLHMV